jgi:methylthioribose-1-phosphate isomerase
MSDTVGSNEAAGGVTDASVAGANSAIAQRVQAIVWEGDHLSLLDQRLLPHSVERLRIDSLQGAADAITAMVVRGAPAIGITAAYGAVLGAQRLIEHGDANWRQSLRQQLSTLDKARPTAINLRWATDRVRQLLDAGSPSAEHLLSLAVQIHADDVAANHTMGRLGAAELGAVRGVLTHCNAGALATGGYGTALGVIRSAFADGAISEVFADETRPWLQGARLTAWELAMDGIPVRLVAEGAAPWLMHQGHVGAVIVGADRVVANGDTANKIGTYALALSARHHGLKFMVVAPSSTIDMTIASGADIPIEERPGEELLTLQGQRLAPPGVGAWNPVFDVTPANLVDVLVTERGVVRNPNIDSMRALMAGG